MIHAAKRSIEIDFFRGFALIAIALDHIPSSVLSHVMLHNYAYCDSAEVFVFVSGYACASSWLAIEARKGEAAARQRFVRRAREIYAAYLLTAALMLVCGALALLMHIDAPIIAMSGWNRFMHQPFAMIANIALFRDQPYLAAVLPMYVVLVLLVAVAMPLVKRSPDLALFASFMTWLAGCWLGQWLPDATSAGWAFNPFAWQAMFTLGVLCRLCPPSHAFQRSPSGTAITVIALLLVAGFAIVRLCIDDTPPPGYLKQNLASVRIVSFAAVAWLAAQAARAGWIAHIAKRMPGIVNIGQQGLVCFVGGAISSIVIDMLLRSTHTSEYLPARLAADALTIGALWTLAGGARFWKSIRFRPALT